MKKGIAICCVIEIFLLPFLDLVCMHCTLQISEVVNSMKDLIDYSRETGTGPMGKLSAIFSSLICASSLFIYFCLLLVLFRVFGTGLLFFLVFFFFISLLFLIQVRGLERTLN